jgi:hypothetical protein
VMPAHHRLRVLAAHASTALKLTQQQPSGAGWRQGRGVCSSAAAAAAAAAGVHSTDTAAAAAAQILARARAAEPGCRAKIGHLPEGLAPQDEQVAYVIQDALHEVLLREGTLGPIVGTKIGCTTPVRRCSMDRQTGRHRHSALRS